MYNTLSNFSYAKAQPLSQRQNNPSTKLKQTGNYSLGKTFAFFPRQNLKPVSESIPFREFNRANSDYQVGCNNVKTICNPIYNQEKISIDEKIKSLTQRVRKNQEQILSLKSNKEIGKNSNLEHIDYKQIIEECKKQLYKMIDDKKENLQQFKGSIKEFKQSLSKTIKQKQFDFEIQTLNYKLKDLSADLKVLFSQNINESIQTNNVIRQIQLDRVKSQLGEKFNKICEFNKSIQESLKILLTLKTTEEYRISSKVFKNQPIKFVHEENIVCNNNLGEEISKTLIQTTIYYIDNQGYLLDANKHYIVNFDDKQIKLGQTQMNLLRKINVIP